jgi:hypothetical protein
MSLLQPICKTTVLLVIAVLLAACGAGIAVDPFDRPRANDPGGDGSHTETEDASLGDDVASSGGDASVGEDVARSDSRTDAPELLDRAAENGAINDDAARDRSVDRSADAEIDRDASVDAATDRSVDAGVDAGSDRDAPGTDPDTGDVPSESRDAPKDSEREVVTADGSDGCSVGCGGAEFDYYVDASAPPGGDGSQAAPFRTISAAVEAQSHAPSQARKVHVAAGTYDEALGEIFPLVLRGLSLEGAGQDKTFIVGTGVFDHSEGGPKNQRYFGTVIAGDRVLPTKLSRLSLRPLAPVPAHGYYGVFCDRGNATGEVASPAGQTHLDEIAVGPGFDTSVLVLTSTIPTVTGCNMLMTRSTVTGGWQGIVANGCDGSDKPGPVMLEMGTDDPTSGNTVTWMQSVNGVGDGVYVGGCVALASFQNNTMTDCSRGLSLGGSANPFVARPYLIKRNTFARLSDVGVFAQGVFVVIEEISDNRFLDTTRVQTSFERAVGLRITNADVRKVRRNVFAGNDIGLRFDEGAEVTDLGRPGDPGGNVFYCNSGIDNWYGSDVVVFYQPMSRRGVREADGGADPNDGGPDAGDGDSPASLPFAGNSWDHGPPRVETIDGLINGLEISLENSPPLVFDLSGSSMVTTPCPAGRIR